MEIPGIPRRAVLKWNPTKVNPATNKPGVWEGDIPMVLHHRYQMKRVESCLHHETATESLPSSDRALLTGHFPEHYEPLECPIQETRCPKSEG